MNTPKIDRIDVHTHYFPPDLPDFAQRTDDDRWPSLRIDSHERGRIMRGPEVFRTVASTCWDLDARIVEMDAAGITTQVLTPVPVTLTYWAPTGDAAHFARLQNDMIAEAARCHPGRFIGFGSVPLPNPDASVAELLRAQSIGLAGVEIGASIAGLELDDPVLLPFFEAAAATGMRLLVHPGDNGVTRRSGVPYDFSIGMHTDTALAATALVFGGVLERFPALRIVLAHGCGSFAWSYPRIARGATLLPRPMPIGSADDLVRLLWADSLVFDPVHLPVLFARFGAEHVVLGSDYPFYPPTFGTSIEMLQQAEQHGMCTHDQAVQIVGANGRRFLSDD